MKQTLRDLILKHINTASGHVNKGEIYMISQREGYSPETGARCARQLAEEGLINVSYYKGKRNQELARYAALDIIETPKVKREPTFQEINGQLVAIFS